MSNPLVNKKKVTEGSSFNQPHHFLSWASPFSRIPTCGLSAAHLYDGYFQSLRHFFYFLLHLFSGILRD